LPHSELAASTSACPTPHRGDATASVRGASREFSQ
jgi:hypothetical protein